MSGVDAVALAEAFRAAYPGRTEDECRMLAAEVLTDEARAFSEWCKAADSIFRRKHIETYAPPDLVSAYPVAPMVALRDLLRPLWRDEP